MTLSHSLRLAAVAGCLLAFAGPAATQDTPVTSNDVERFCTNITDAARDQRYALQAEELRSLQAEVDARIAALEEKRAEYEEWLDRRETFLAKARENVVDIYGRMRPDAAAERLTELGPELAAGILMKLDARKAGIIMNEMETKAAAGVTSIMASAAREKDPS
ncbi:MotE family protein [Aliihoeflea sp. 2WW]|uniref:MotE family protein n=1 Tax=Aliihoeflea sp. 2WW TaxID=1381123 RepID=UPI000467B2D7|nr:MotE family protein [Aliihoeflea sp. 2WW]